MSDAEVKPKSALTVWPRSLRSLFVLMGVFLGVADVWSKNQIQEILAGEEVVSLLPFLNLVSVRNEGVAFGMLSGLLPYEYLSIFALCVAVGCYVFLIFYKKLELRSAMIAALLLGGAAGNGFDRLINGYVHDFIDFHVAGWHYPAFNLADIIICVAIAILFWDTLWPKSREKQQSTND